MAIPTSRTKENSSIEIDESLCTGCGLCVQVCSDFSLKMTNDKATISQSPMFGCFGCGHCMMICPVDAIQIAGRATSPDYLFKLTEKIPLQLMINSLHFCIAAEAYGNSRTSPLSL